MKLLLVGPYPPPHGGVSVHVARARRELQSAGIDTRVLNIDRGAPPSRDYVRVRGGIQLAALVASHAARGWTVHVHSNGHNLKGWLVSLLCGLAARTGRGSVLTLHSGITPQFLSRSGRSVRTIARSTCRLYRRVICVNTELRAAIARLGVASSHVEILPAFLGPSLLQSPVPVRAVEWMRTRTPLLSTALFFRPEYGFELLVHAVGRIRDRFPGLGLVVMGDSEHASAAQNWLTAAGHDRYVLLLGDVAHEICLAVLARSDLFVRATLADGDATSVREALSLGTPVVASNVGERPEGVVLFNAGDSTDLEAKLATGIALGRKPAAPETATAPGRVGRLLEIYAQVAG